MSEKRRDNKGRILKTGESQRKDLTYQFRYNDTDGKRRTVYAHTLNELREKEKEIQKLLDAGVAISTGNMNLGTLLTEYIAAKRNIRSTTRASYESVIRRIMLEPIAHLHIREIKPVQAKKWMISLYERGYSYGTIKYYHAVIKGAYCMAIENDYVIKNPFDYRIDFLTDNTNERSALNEAQQKAFFDFLSGSSRYSKHYDMCVILVETGIRIGELCGLTFNDVDLSKGLIHINHQIVKTSDRKMYIAPPKTNAGNRIIPLTPRAIAAFESVMRDRPAQRIEPFIDGHTGFIFLTRQGKPYFSSLVDHLFVNINNAFLSAGVSLPKITPHVLRHTFCTNMINTGMMPKHVQYLMGHSEIDITMNVYANVDLSFVITSMRDLALIN